MSSLFKEAQRDYPGADRSLARQILRSRAKERRQTRIAEGRERGHRSRLSDYEVAAEQRKTELYASIMRGLDGSATPIDRARIRETIAEFEEPLGDGSVRVTMVDFT